MRTTLWTARLKPGRMAETLAAAKPHIEASRAEPGCLAFDFYANVDGSDTLVTVEQYVDQAALDAHRQTPHSRAFMPILAANIESFRMDWLDPPDDDNPVP